MEKVRYMISDAANIVNVESHVLRYWEEELALNIPRNEMGHRYYTKENIEEFQKIKELKEQGYQLKAIRMIVHNGPLDMSAVDVAGDMSELPKQEHSENKVSKQLHSENRLPQKTAKEAVESGGLVQVNQNIPQSILDNTDKMAQFTDLMTQIVGKALSANNDELSQNISEEVGKQVVKEMNYLMREREEAEEERFRKLDAAIRGNLKKKDEQKRIWRKKGVVVNN